MVISTFMLNKAGRDVADVVLQGCAVGYTGLVSLGITFFLARDFGPEKFGIYSYALTWASLVFILQDGGLGTLIFREKTLPSPALAVFKGDLSSLSRGHALLVTAAGVLLGLAVPSPYRVEVSFAVLCFGFQAVTQFISSEMRAVGRFSRDAFWQIQGRTLSASGIVLGVMLLPEPWVVMAGWGFGLFISLFFSPVSHVVPRFGALCHREIRRATFSLMAINIATTLYNRCDILLLEHLTGDAAQVGGYAAVYRVLDGIILLASPFSWIWFRKLRMASETKDHFASLLVWMCLTMVGVAVLILGCGILYGKALVAWIFGEGYLESVQILPWLLGALIFALPNGILTMGAIAQNRERGYAMAAGLGALVNIGLNIAWIPEFGARGAAWATVATEAFLMFGLMICLHNALRRKEKTIQDDPPC